ncbi:MAG: ABC transporter ATP-binding protein [Leucobacter sp.]
MASGHAGAEVMAEHGTAETEREAVVELAGISKRFGDEESGRMILEGLDFSVRREEYVSIVGPSGSGKSTVLRCIAGLLAPTSGEVRFEGVAVQGPPPSLAVVFQDYSRSLLPWLTIEGNVTLPLRGKVDSKTERRERAQEALAAVGLGHTLRQYPWQLSGGMQQRVAIARALAYRPKVLLMDEPFASVDAQTRSDLEDLLLALRRRFAITVVSVTHDIDEAVYMSDRVIVLGGQPARVAKDFAIDLGTDRDQISTKSEPRFAELRSQVLREVRHDLPQIATP